jgi:hypothetical protein
VEKIAKFQSFPGKTMKKGRIYIGITCGLPGLPMVFCVPMAPPPGCRLKEK